MGFLLGFVGFLADNCVNFARFWVHEENSEMPQPNARRKGYKFQLKTVNSLIIDDEENVRAAIVQILESEGHAAIEAADGEKGNGGDGDGADGARIATSSSSSSSDSEAEVSRRRRCVISISSPLMSELSRTSLRAATKEEEEEDL